MHSFRRDLMCSAAIAALATASPLLVKPAYANPQGAQVVGGQATVSTSGNTLNVDQTTNIAIIDWNSFNIAAGETTKFNQPSAAATAVNRIGGNDPSQIFGDLLANGRVIIINGNGILFGPQANINVGSLVATTHDASNADLMSGKASFSGTTTGTVENQGSINAAQDGVIGLMAGAVSNSGVINARLGKVTLGATNQFTLDFTGDGLISFPIGADVLAQAIGANGQPVEALIVNLGRIEGGTVQLSARAAQGLVQNVVDMGGIVTATGIHNSGGNIVLDGGTGRVAVSGTLDASSQQASGGNITISGGDITLSGAMLDARGSSGGGSVTVGGWSTDTLSADAATRIDVSAKSSGDGGNVSAIAVQTRFAGSIAARGGEISGDGGDVETSGKVVALAGVRVDTRAPHGTTGTWLIDPYTITISDDPSTGGHSFEDTSTDSNINVDDLVFNLATTNVSIAAHGIAPGSGGSGENPTSSGSGENPTSSGSENPTSSGSENPTSSGSENPTSSGGENPTSSGSENPTSSGSENPTSSGSENPTSSGGDSGSVQTTSNITVLVPISWSAPTVLELGASDTIDIRAPITVGGGGGLILGPAGDITLAPQTIKIGADINFTNDASGGSSVFNINPIGDGTWELNRHATVSFSDTGYTFAVNGTTFTLIGDVAALTANLGGGPAGYYALANDLDMSGTIYESALAGNFTGVFEGFNHAIDNLTIEDLSNVNAGMFASLGVNATVRDLSLTHLSIASSADNASVGGLAGTNSGTVTNVSIAGAVTAAGASANVGGLTGSNAGTINSSSASTAVSGGANANAGGLVGDNDGDIDNSSASGAVSGGANANIGGFVGRNDGTVSSALSTSFVRGGSGASIGGFAGLNANAITASYFDTGTSGTATGVGLDSGSPTNDVTGETTAALQAALPSGFDGTIWAIDAGNTYAYLIDAYSGTPQVISGTVYSDAGVTALGSSSSELVTVGVLLDGESIADLTAGANGYYYNAVQPGTLSGMQQLLTYISGNEVKANTYVQDSAGNQTADLHGGYLRVLSGVDTLSSVLGGLTTAIGGNSGNDFLYGGGTSSADVTSLELGAISAFDIDQALDAGDGTLIIDAAASVTQSAPLTVSKLELLGSSADYALTDVTNSVGTLAANTGAVSLHNSGNLEIGMVNGLSGVTSSGFVMLTAANLTVASGATVTAGSGDDVVLAATGTFANNEGNSAVAVSGGGRWLIYSDAPDGNTFNNLDSGNTAIWNATFATLVPGAVTANGNRYIFGDQPTLTFTTTDTTKVFGTDGSAAIASAYIVSGYEAGVSGAFLGDDAESVFSGAPLLTSDGTDATATAAGNPYAINSAAGTLNALNGYTFAFANTGELTVEGGASISTPESDAAHFLNITNTIFVPPSAPKIGDDTSEDSPLCSVAGAPAEC